MEMAMEMAMRVTPEDNFMAVKMAEMITGDNYTTAGTATAIQTATAISTIPKTHAVIPNTADGSAPATAINHPTNSKRVLAIARITAATEELSASRATTENLVLAAASIARARPAAATTSAPVHATATTIATTAGNQT